MSTDKQPTNRVPTITLFVALLNVVILLALSGVVGSLRSDVDLIRKEVVTLEDLARYVAPVTTPADILTDKCTSCHADRRFLAEHGNAAEVQHVIERMQALPDAHISVTDRDKIHSALKLMKCQNCHTEEIYGRMAALNKKERQEAVLHMWEKSNAAMSREELLDILKAYDQIQGF